jgi:hypothetical protein
MDQPAIRATIDDQRFVDDGHGEYFAGDDIGRPASDIPTIF